MAGQEPIHFIEQIGRDKGLDKDVIIDAIKAAVVSAARKRYTTYDVLEVELNSKTGKVAVFALKIVVDKVEDPTKEIDLSEARKLEPNISVEETVKITLETEDFGRIAAQTAKQVILQRVREAERKRIFDEYQSKEGELVNGVIQRLEKGNIIVDLGKAEGILPKREQAYRENFRRGDRLRTYILEVKDSSKGPQIILSRTHPNILIKLFELEVPEISENIVEIKCAAREPSGRSKIAVISHDSDVDPVGACVGMRGSRVQAVVQELRGEKIDIIEWKEDDVSFVKNALSPAEVKKIVVHEEDRYMEVIVEDDQLSLAIGKKGQNVRLAAKLTQWKIDIKNFSEYSGAQSEGEAVSDEPEVGQEVVSGPEVGPADTAEEAATQEVDKISETTEDEPDSIPEDVEQGEVI